jgi:hypothetical protein
MYETSLMNEFHSKFTEIHTHTHNIDSDQWNTRQQKIPNLTNNT